MRVFVACEYSGIVTSAFLERGHEALSCDILDTEADVPHYRGDARDVLARPLDFFTGPIDLLIAHPPCTYLTNAGVRWLHERPGRWEQMREGAELFKAFLDADVPRVAVENPVMHRYGVEIIGRRQDQTVHPYHFGHREQKQIGLWLRGLPPLAPTDDVKAETMALPYGERAKVHYASPGKDRGKIRSRFFEGVAAAMADQWGTV